LRHTPNSLNWRDRNLQKKLLQGNSELSKQQINKLLEKYYRVIQSFCRNNQFDRALELLEKYEAICQVRHLSGKDSTSQSIKTLAIDVCFQLGDKEKAKNRLLEQWRSDRNNFEFELPYNTAIVETFLEGLLKEEINISQEQITNFIETIQNYSTIRQPSKIPSVSDCKQFMETWDRELFAKRLRYRAPYGSQKDLEQLAEYYPSEVARQTCSRSPATEEEIQELEHRLGTSLPPSYRNFLLYSNGWTIVDRYSQLFNTQNINWYCNLNQEFVNLNDEIEEDEISDEVYFQYGEHQDCCTARFQYLKTALQISDYEEGYVYLLNPMVVDERGEWEAWDLGSKYPGAYRYRSFWEMMQATYEAM
jgi:hypothetical protein